MSDAASFANGARRQPLSRTYRAQTSAIAFLALSLLVACQPSGVGATDVPSTPVAASTPASSPNPGPTFAPPATQVFPTPELTPTKGPTPAVPEAIAIDRELNIPYTSDQALDVYWPSSGNGWPIVVILHGGNVNKRWAGDLAVAVAGQGAVVFVPEYQSYEPPPDQIVTGAEEAACAIRFARAHGPEYGGDPNRVVVVGHSGGGAFGALVALAGDRFHDACRGMAGSASPDVFIGLDGAYDLLRYIPEESLRAAPADEWLKISPYAAIDSPPSPPDLPFHLFVGKEAELLQDAQAFRDALQRAGYRVSLTQFPAIEHMRMASGHHANTVWAIANLMRQ